MPTFPLRLEHPHYAPAVISDRSKGDPPGSPARFPPIIVNNSDQLEEYIAKGYLSTTDLSTLRTEEMDDPDPNHEYPKWVKGKIVKNREEEEAYLASYVEAPPPPPPPDIHKLPPGLASIGDQLRDALVNRARAAGVPIDESLSTEEIRETIHRRIMGNG